MTPHDLVTVAATALGATAGWQVAVRLVPKAIAWLASFRAKQATGDAAVLAADVKAKADMAIARTEQDGETERAEITGQISMTKLAIDYGDAQRAFAAGVTTKLAECEERSRKADESHRAEVHGLVVRCGRLVAEVTERYEKILSDSRTASDERDAATRLEVKVIVDHAEAMNATFQAQTKEFDAYRARHPSDPRMPPVVVTALTRKDP